MELRPFHEQVLSATNDPFRILGMFTGCLMFETGVKIDAEVLVTPDTDVPLILGTQIMEENKMSIDFHSRQLMMETESNIVNLQLLGSWTDLLALTYVNRKHLWTNQPKLNPLQLMSQLQYRHGISRKSVLLQLLTGTSELQS